MENNSGLKPAGHAILVKPYEPNIESGMIVIPDTVKVSHQTIEQRAIVIEVGPEAWSQESQPRAKPGDKVLISQYSGHMAVGTKDKQQYRFVNDRDIFALIEVD